MKSCNAPAATRRQILAMLVAVALAAVTFAAKDASAAGGHLTRLTFSQPVALPGVVLPAGSYVFQVATPTTSHDVVRVLRDTGEPIYRGFTTRAERPHTGDLKPTVTFHEASRGAPAPIAVWYPAGVSSGHQFMYR